MSWREELKELLQEKSDLIEARKEIITRTWAYQSVDHLPVLISVDWLPWPRTFQEELKDRSVQLRNRLYSVKQSLYLLPDDYIPSVFVDIGCVGLSEAFGGEIFLGDDPNQTPAIAKPKMNTRNELEKALAEGLQPDFSRGFAAEYLKRLMLFLSETENQIYVSGMDLNGPMGVAMDLLGSTLLFELLIEEDPLLHNLLGIITQAICDFTDRSITQAGGTDHFTTFDFFWYWCPVKGHVSSDLSSMYSGRYFDEIERPYLERILQRYGGGLLHNCGPNPCTAQYAQIPGLRGLNVSYRYSQNDLSQFRRHLSGKVVYFFMDFHDEWGSVEDYRHIMEELSPEVIGIPIVSCINPSIDIPSLYKKYRAISEEYAHRIFG